MNNALKAYALSLPWAPSQGDNKLYAELGSLMVGGETVDQLNNRKVLAVEFTLKDYMAYHKCLVETLKAIEITQLPESEEEVELMKEKLLSASIFGNTLRVNLNKLLYSIPRDVIS